MRRPAAIIMKCRLKSIHRWLPRNRGCDWCCSGAILLMRGSRCDDVRPRGRMRSISASITAVLALTTCLVSLVLPRSAAAFDPPVDPCSLFTAEQVSAALDLKAMTGKRVVATLCEWDTSVPGKKLTAGFVSASAWEQTRALREQMKGIARTPIAGLGEEAVFAASQLTNSLEVKKGRAVLGLHLYGFTPEQSKAKEIALARVALGKF